MFRAVLDTFPGATFDAPKTGTYHYDLVDEDDGHVAHAAIIGKAEAIVTDDKRAGFRASASLLAAQIEIVFPAEFAANTVAAHPGRLQAVIEMSRRMTKPAATPLELLDELRRRYGMEEVFELVSPQIES